MMTTLLKHEWLRTRGMLGSLFGIVALLGVLGSLLGITGWPLLSTLGSLLGFLAVFILVPATQLLLAADYWKSGYGRTGYFTHSIPVRGSTIYWAKLVWAMLASLAALVLTVALGLVAWWEFAKQSGMINAPSFAAIGEWSRWITAVTPAWMIAAGAVIVLASFLVWPIYYYFSVSIGHESRLSGLGVAAPVVVFVGVYICIQILSLVAMVAIPVGVGMVDGDSLGFVSFNMMSELAAGANATNDVMPIGFLVSMGLILVFCLWRTARSWNHKVALT